MDRGGSSDQRSVRVVGRILSPVFRHRWSHATCRSPQITSTFCTGAPEVPQDSVSRLCTLTCYLPDLGVEAPKRIAAEARVRVRAVAVRVVQAIHLVRVMLNHRRLRPLQLGIQVQEGPVILNVLHGLRHFGGVRVVVPESDRGYKREVTAQAAATYSVEYYNSRFCL